MIAIITRDDLKDYGKPLGEITINDLSHYTRQVTHNASVVILRDTSGRSSILKNRFECNCGTELYIEMLDDSDSWMRIRK